MFWLLVLLHLLELKPNPRSLRRRRERTMSGPNLRGLSLVSPSLIPNPRVNASTVVRKDIERKIVQNS
jgi:hypothetical protein